MANKKDPFYAKGPKVPKKKVAGENPVGTQPLGTAVLAIAPPHPGKMRGMGMLQHPLPHPKVKGSGGYVRVAKEPSNRLRLSGHTGAHQVGKR